MSGQFDLGLADTRLDPTAVDPESVRRELREVLERAESAVNPREWSERDHRYWRVVFPQMAGWLPEAEREPLVLKFMAELARMDWWFDEGDGE